MTRIRKQSWPMFAYVAMEQHTWILNRITALSEFNRQIVRLCPPSPPNLQSSDLSGNEQRKESF
jgi:hypothetical protein